jgi:glycosyltransferase involved in cell wall biosynthesis
MINKRKTHVYLVIACSGIGGTEKRFIELWNYMCEQGINNVSLVITSELYKVVNKIEYFKKVSPDNPRLIIIKARRFREMIPRLFMIAIKAGPGTIFHYPLTGLNFIHTLMFQKVIRSLPMVDISFIKKGISGLLNYYQLLRAWKLDVLNPRVKQQIKINSLLNRTNYYLTRGNSIRTDSIVAEYKKENWIIFLGRFTLEGNDTKNVLKYTKAIPYIQQYLISNNINDAIYYLLGYGSLEKKLKQILSEKAYEKIPIRFYFEPKPELVLKSSKVILSIQKYSNYPSRSLLEAMSAMNLPIITDIGESRLMANDFFAEFISPDFNEQQIAVAIHSILKLPIDVFLEKAKIARKFVKDNFSIQTHLEYYMSLYETN